MSVSKRSLASALRMALLFPGVLSACAEGTEEPLRIGVAGAFVQGGAPDSSDTGVVGIHRTAGGKVVSSCTGALIAPNVVLTARHCVAPVVQSSSNPCEGWSLGTTSLPEDLHVFNDQTYSGMTVYKNAIQIRLAPSDGAICGNDLAILILESTYAALQATPIEPRVNSAPSNGESYSAVGYGKTCPTCTNGGISRYRLDGLTVQCVGACGQPELVADAELWGDDGVCAGDSGGPALDSTGKVIGIASRASESGGQCVSGIYERVDTWKDFLIEAARDGASIGGYAVPAWAAGGPGAGLRPLPSCSTAGLTGYDATNRSLTLTMGTATSAIILALQGELTVNGQKCVDAAGQPVQPSQVNRITLFGSAAQNDTVVLDLLGGSIGPSMNGSKGGIRIDLGTGADKFQLRGSTGADRIGFGESGGAIYVELGGDAYADARVRGAETVDVALSDGNDTFNAMGVTSAGKPISAVFLTPGVTSLSPLSVGFVVRGGEGNDTLGGGAGNDTLYGGPGDDRFTSPQADGSDVYMGEDGADTIDYAGRTTAVVVDIGPSDFAGDADDGEVGEFDDVQYDVESITGGKGADTLVGSNISNTIRGGEGADAIDGGAGNGNCSLDSDLLYGDAGNDTFDMGSASNCGDKVTGGSGNDTIDYQDRTENLSVSLDGVANDGEFAEGDNVTSDVETVLAGSGDDELRGSTGTNVLHGGSGDDTIYGGAGNDTLIGGPGNDRLNGESGNDAFVELTADDPSYSLSLSQGAGNDVLNGGVGIDSLDYADRGNLQVSLCVDPLTATGASTLTDGLCDSADGETGAGESDNVINIERLTAGAGDDAIWGGSADEWIECGAGADTVNAGGGNDTVYGSDGNDTLHGGAGADLLDGADGTDNLDGGEDGDVCVDVAGTSMTACEL